MILNIPLAIWFGMLAFISMFITAGLGIATFKYHKATFKQHMLFAKLTILLALVHLGLGIALWFFGVLI